MENGRLSLVTVLRTFSLSIAVIVVCSLMNARQRRLLDDMSHIQLLASGNKREEKKNQHNFQFSYNCSDMTRFSSFFMLAFDDDDDDDTRNDECNHE